MTIIHSAILNHEQKLIVKDSLIKYVCQLQMKYFRDGAIPFNEYWKKMKAVDLLCVALHVTGLYKQSRHQ